MELHRLKFAPGAKAKRKRIGRGEGSGRGGTATKGHKGAQSRSGYKTRPHREGGQTPLQRRLPKVGFKNPNRHSYIVLTLLQLEKLWTKRGEKQKLTRDVLIANRYVRKEERYKVLSSGKLSKPIHVAAHAISKSAQKELEEKGGTITLLS